MKPIVRVMLLMGVLYSSCSFFPGFIQPWANRVSGVGGAGEWTLVGPAGFSHRVQSDKNGRYAMAWDMAVNSLGQIMVALNNADDNLFYAYQYTPGAGWTGLGTYPVTNESYGLRQVSVCYSYNGMQQIPFAGLAFDDMMAIPQVRVVSFNEGVNDWVVPDHILMSYSYVSLVKTGQVRSMGPDFMVYRNDQYIIQYTNNVVGTNKSTSIVPQFFRTAYDPYLNYQAVALGSASYWEQVLSDGIIPPFSWGTGLTTSSGVNQVGIEVSGHTGPIHTYLSYVNNNRVEVWGQWATNQGVVGTVGSGSYNALDTAMNESQSILFLAMADTSRSVVEVYRFDLLSSGVEPLGTITGINARSVLLECRPGSDDLYLGLINEADDTISVYAAPGD